jgi:hypothetical protein
MAPRAPGREDQGMDDQSIHHRINELIDAEHQLRGASEHSPDDRARLRELEESLDQCWDLLRQRRAHREFGQDPGEAHSRPVTEVEGYLQ